MTAAPHYGVSFSLKQCRNFGIDQMDCLDWLIDEMGFRRFRLMSYWNEHEKQPGVYDFSALDKQLARIEKVNGVITLCLGARQPRWPENHWPDWAWRATHAERTVALLRYLEVVAKRYRGRSSIVSYQLENEALLKSFGTRAEIDRPRLRQEFQLIKALDSETPVIMTTSTAWGVPVREPIPDIVGFSYYVIAWNNQKQRYQKILFPPTLHRLRRWLVEQLLDSNAFIHELQLEPWGPTAIWKMNLAEQDKSMSIEQIKRNLQLAQKTKLTPTDLWGGEWWYWRAHTLHDPAIADAIKRHARLMEA